MRIIFVRHGEPDYRNDCLTATGKVQAEAAANRLAGENIKEIYSSPMGRAWQTAQATARKLGLPVHKLEYMHEITWGGEGIPENGHPWTLADRMIEEGFDFYREDWKTHPYFRGNAALDNYHEVAGKFDEFLAGQGYRHEGNRFFCETGSDKTIALFSHGGSGACVLGSILALPFPYVCSVMPYRFTSVIIVELPNRPGEYVRPRLDLFNDSAHISGEDAWTVKLQEEPDAT